MQPRRMMALEHEGPEHVHPRVGTLAGRHAAQIRLHLEACGRVDGDHLDGFEGVDALSHCQAQQIVEVAVRKERVGVAVIGHKAAEPRVHLVPHNGRG